MKDLRDGPSGDRPIAASGARTEELRREDVAEGTQRQFEGSRPANAGGHAERDAILRETYRLNHEIGYIGFRDQYLNDPDVVKEWPDPAVRERELRKFWDNEQEGRFASYREDFAGDSVQVLTAYRDSLRGLLAGDINGQIAYYNQASERGRSIRLQDDGLGEIKAAGKAFPSPGELEESRPAPGQEQNHNRRQGKRR